MLYSFSFARTAIRRFSWMLNFFVTRSSDRCCFCNRKNVFHPRSFHKLPPRCSCSSTNASCSSLAACERDINSSASIATCFMVEQSKRLRQRDLERLSNDKAYCCLEIIPRRRRTSVLDLWICHLYNESGIDPQKNNGNFFFALPPMSDADTDTDPDDVILTNIRQILKPPPPKPHGWLSFFFGNNKKTLQQERQEQALAYIIQVGKTTTSKPHKTKMTKWQLQSCLVDVWPVISPDLAVFVESKPCRDMMRDLKRPVDWFVCYSLLIGCLLASGWQCWFHTQETFARFLVTCDVLPGSMVPNRNADLWNGDFCVIFQQLQIIFTVFVHVIGLLSAPFEFRRMFVDYERLKHFYCGMYKLCIALQQQ